MVFLRQHHRLLQQRVDGGYRAPVDGSLVQPQAVLGLVKDAFSSTAALASLAAFYLAGAAIIFFARLRQYAKGDKA